MALDFPASSASPFTAPNGVVYTWNADGYWEAKADPNDFDSDYLKLDATNGPVTGPLAFEGLTTHEAGVSVTGGDSTSIETGLVNTGSALAFRFEDHNIFYGNSLGRLTVPMNTREQSGVVMGINVSGSVSGTTVSAYSFYDNSNYTGSDTLTDHVAFYASPSGYTGTVTNKYGVYIGDFVDVADNVYGVYSSVATGTKNNFNFFAAGDAPNYFRGITEHEGGVSVTGGATGSIDNGIITNGYTDRLFVYTGGEQVAQFAGKTLLIAPDFAPGSTEVSPIAGLLLRSGGSAADEVCQDGDQILQEFQIKVPGGGAQRIAHFGAEVVGGVGSAGSASQFVFKTRDTSSAQTPFTTCTIDYAGGVRNNNRKGGANDYSFYAAGSAPNYFAGSTILKGSTSEANTNAYILATKNSSISPRLQIQRQGIKTSSENALEVLASSEATPLQFGLKYDGSSTRSALAGDYRLTDYRIFSPTAIQNASQIVSQLSPKLEGFIAHELQTYVPEAVIGTQDATEAIGTLADYNGTVLETEVTEPSAEELTYTEEIETDGVTTATVRTRTWTPSGTRPVYQGVDQTKLIPLLTKALQEALDRIEVLEAAAT